MHTIVTIWLGIIPIVLIAASIFRFYHLQILYEAIQKTNNIETVKICQSEFGFKLPTTLLACRKEKKLCKVNQCDNYMLRLFRSVT